MAHRRTATCYRCARIAVRRTDGDVPRGWATAVTAVLGTGPVAQQVVTVCDRCPLPIGTLNCHPETQTRHVRH